MSLSSDGNSSWLSKPHSDGAENAVGGGKAGTSPGGRCRAAENTWLRRCMSRAYSSKVLEPAFCRACAQHLPCPHILGEAFQGDGPKVAVFDRPAVSRCVLAAMTTVPGSASRPCAKL
jgi:hypothetical protein